MHKDELLQLHSLLCQMKRFFQENRVMTDGAFDEYEDLQVSPQHIHKSKTDHKKAVFLLGKGLSEIALMTQPEHAARLQERFLKLASDAPEPALEEPAAPAAEKEELPPFAVAALSRSAV